MTTPPIPYISAPADLFGVLEKLNVEMVKCKQLEGENGWSKCTLIDGDRTFEDYNQGGVRGKWEWQERQLISGSTF